jgi:hypothetical protein
MAHVTTPDAVIRIVEAKTIHPPQARCGTKSRMSTRKASSVTRRVGKRSIRRPSRYRAECDGEWKCAAAASPRQTRFINAAMGCTMRMEERVCRELKGRLKSLFLPASLKRVSATKVSILQACFPFLMYL